MPIKPTNEPPSWASNAAYSGGPDVGKPPRSAIPVGIAAEGHRAGKNDPTLAQYFNDWLALVWALVHWVYLGSSEGEADAHICETRIEGTLRLARLHAQAPDGHPESESLYAEANATGHAAKFYSEALQTTCFVQNNGSGAALFAGGPLGSIFVGGTGPTIPALKAQGFANAPGGIFIGGAGDTNGAEGEATGVGTSGLRGQGATRGVLGVATSTSGTGTRGETAAAATSSAAGVDGVALGDGKGVRGTSVNGPAGHFTASGDGAGGDFNANGEGAGITATSNDGLGAHFTADGDKATTRHQPRSTDPVITSDGDLWYRTGIGFKTRRSSTTRYVYDTDGGMAFAQDYEASGSVDDTQTTILTATLSGVNAPEVVGIVLLEVHLEVGRAGAAGTHDLIFLLSDDTAGVSPVSKTIKLYQAPGNLERCISYKIPYLLPAAGNRTFSVKLQSTNSNFIDFEDASLVIHGVF